MTTTPVSLIHGTLSAHRGALSFQWRTAGWTPGSQVRGYRWLKQHGVRGAKGMVPLTFPADSEGARMALMSGAGVPMEGCMESIVGLVAGSGRTYNYRNQSNSYPARGDLPCPRRIQIQEAILDLYQEEHGAVVVD